MALLYRINIFFLISIIAVSSSYAQVDEKGFISGGSKDVAQSIGLTQGKRWALLVGIADYPSSETFDVQPLKSPVNDVNAIGDFLKDPQKGGFDEDNVFVLTDRIATKRDILMTLNDISNRAVPDDMVIIYFSGHGYRPIGEKTSYLVPYDYDMVDVETTCINFDDLSRKIQRIEARKIIVILDACHSGAIKPKGAKSAGLDGGVIEKFSEAFLKAEGRHLLLSSDENEVSWETDKGGVFTQFLLEGLNGQADKNNDGIVTFLEVALYVENKVPEYTRIRFPKAQTPMRRGDLGGQVRGDIPLAVNIPKINSINQEKMRKKRYEAIISKEMSGELREFSLDMIKTAYDKGVANNPLTEIESSFLMDVDALQSGKISLDEYILRAQILYDRLRGKPKIPEIQESKVKIMPDLEGIAPATILIRHLPVNTKIFVNDTLVVLPHKTPPGNYAIRLERTGFQTINISKNLVSGQNFMLEPRWFALAKNRGIGLLGAYILPDDADSTYGLGITANFGNVFTSHIKFCGEFITYETYNSEEYEELAPPANANFAINRSPFKAFGYTEEWINRAFALSVAPRFYPIRGNVSPFIVFGPTLMVIRKTWNQSYSGEPTGSASSNEISIGGHAGLGIELYLSPIAEFGASLKYYRMTNDMGSIQFAASTTLMLW